MATLEIESIHSDPLSTEAGVRVTASSEGLMFESMTNDDSVLVVLVLDADETERLMTFAAKTLNSDISDEAFPYIWAAKDLRPSNA